MIRLTSFCRQPPCIPVADADLSNRERPSLTLAAALGLMYFLPQERSAQLARPLAST